MTACGNPATIRGKGIVQRTGDILIHYLSETMPHCSKIKAGISGKVKRNPLSGLPGTVRLEMPGIHFYDRLRIVE